MSAFPLFEFDCKYSGIICCRPLHSIGSHENLKISKSVSNMQFSIITIITHLSEFWCYFPCCEVKLRWNPLLSCYQHVVFLKGRAGWYKQVKVFAAIVLKPCELTEYFDQKTQRLSGAAAIPRRKIANVYQLHRRLADSEQKRSTCVYRAC